MSRPGTGTGTDPPQPAGFAGRAAGRAVPARVVVVLAGAAAAWWITSAVLTAGRGFDITDEGFYLLSYRWWAENHRNFSGAQYVYGPVFAALGRDIAGLRLFRLLTVVVTHAAFAWAFMRWLRTRRPAAPPSRLWEAAGAAAIVAAGGMVYSWLPLTPSYNDLVLLGGLLAMAIALRAATYADQGRPSPAWLYAAAGALAVPVLLARWSAAVLIVFVTAGALAVSAGGARGLLRLAGWAVAGAAATAGLVHLLVVPLTTAIPRMVSVNRLVSRTSYSPVSVLEMYATTGLDLVTSAVVGHAVLLLAAVVAVVARRPGARIAAGVLAAAGAGLSMWRALADGGLDGGAANVHRYPVTLLAVVLFTLVTALVVVLVDRLHRTRSSALSAQGVREWRILGALVVLPVAQAFGTGNAIYVLAFNAFAVWFAVTIAVLTGMEGAPVPARALTAVVTVGALAASTAIATGGLWRHPYRAVPPARATSAVPGVPALDSVKLDPATARRYAALRARLEPYVEPGGRAVIAFDRMAGLVLVLDGRYVGEAWISPWERARAAAGIAADCADGGAWWGTRRPILLFNRPVSEVEVDALARCGLDFATDFRPLAPPEETMGIQVYVPANEAATGPD